MEISIIISCFAALIALGTFCFTVWVYRTHDQRLKTQQDQINEFNLRKLKQEEEERKKAIIQAYAIKNETGTRTIEVYNRGKAIARNFKLDVREASGVYIQNIPKNTQLRPQNSVKIICHLTTTRPDEIIITCNWDDDFKENNYDEISVPLD